MPGVLQLENSAFIPVGSTVLSQAAMHKTQQLFVVKPGKLRASDKGLLLCFCSNSKICWIKAKV